MKPISKSHALFLAVGMILGAIALGIVQAQTSVTTDVRIGARQLEDGRVEVGLQQDDGAGGWTNLEPPANRFLPSDADPGEWRFSNPIGVTAAVDAMDAMSEPDAMPEADDASDEESMPEPETTAEPEAISEPALPIMCVFGHAYPDEDRFWQWTLAGSRVAGVQYGVDLRLYGARDSAEHAADIADCLALEPISIATSLPYADDLAEVLAESQEAGVPLITFNSGADDAASVGSLLHIGLDDFAGGLLAADAFNEAGVSGVLLCVIHEADNIGLRDRCEALAQGYEGGEVENLVVDLQATEDTDDADGSNAVAMQISERIAAGGVGGILTLNDNAGVAALSVLEGVEDDITAASFGFSDAIADAVRDGRMLFVVWDHPVVQGYSAVSAMALAYTLQFSQLNAEAFLNGSKILIQPTLADQDRAAALQSMYELSDQLGAQENGE